MLHAASDAREKALLNLPRDVVVLHEEVLQSSDMMERKILPIVAVIVMGLNSLTMSRSSARLPFLSRVMKAGISRSSQIFSPNRYRKAMSEGHFLKGT